MWRWLKCLFGFHSMQPYRALDCDLMVCEHCNVMAKEKDYQKFKAKFLPTHDR